MAALSLSSLFHNISKHARTDGYIIQSQLKRPRLPSRFDPIGQSPHSTHPRDNHTPILVFACKIIATHEEEGHSKKKAQTWFMNDIHTHTHTHAHPHALIHSYTSASNHTHTHTHPHTQQTRTHIHPHIHTHTPTHTRNTHNHTRAHSHNH